MKIKLILSLCFVFALFSACNSQAAKAEDKAKLDTHAQLGPIDDKWDPNIIEKRLIKNLKLSALALKNRIDICEKNKPSLPFNENISKARGNIDISDYEKIVVRTYLSEKIILNCFEKERLHTSHLVSMVKKYLDNNESLSFKKQVETILFNHDFVAFEPNKSNLATLEEYLLFEGSEYFFIIETKYNEISLEKRSYLESIFPSHAKANQLFE